MITLSGIVELMLSRVLSRLSLVRVTVGYAAMLIVVATTLVILGPRVEDAVVSHMSTNVHNLARGHFATLVGSVFVTSSGFIYVWLPGLICLLALAELFWRGGRLILAFGLGHVGATLIVGVGLAAAIRFGWLPISVARASDVGISYGAVAVLGALTVAIPARWRPGVDRRVAGVRCAGGLCRGRLHQYGASRRTDHRDVAVGPVPCRRTVDASALCAANDRRRVRLPGAGQ
jgi:hypothetical protein